MGRGWGMWVVAGVRGQGPGYVGNGQGTWVGAGVRGYDTWV